MRAHSARLALALIAIAALLMPLTLHPKNSPSPPEEDPVLRAMQAELGRSKSQLKLEGVASPYYIDYRVFDIDGLTAQAAYGALRTNLRARVRFARVVVRVGDYKQDSFWGNGLGVVQLMPVDDDELALRHELWLMTDQAYKAATEALTAKQARLKQYSVVNPVDDFARAEPVRFIGPLAKLDADPAPWLELLQNSSALYRTDPEIQFAQSSLDFHVVNRYYVNSEGTSVRTGQASYQLSVSANTQAVDGMLLERSFAIAFSDGKQLPAPQVFLNRTRALFGTLKNLREAPLAEEEYRGPVLFSSDAASTVFSDLVGENVLGLKPDLGQSARTDGQYASSLRARVLPDFLSVVDDPTLPSLSGKALMGHYDVDDEGVKAMRVEVIQKGTLLTYLLGRTPIRDVPTSNGHGRAGLPANFPGPSLGNLLVSSSEPVPREELKKRLLDLCRQRDLPYGYFVDAMGGLTEPRLLYRVWVKDGHEELVRGATFADLDTRALRNDLVAAGDDVNVENRAQSIPHSIANPSILFDELEVKRQDRKNLKLPEYPPPAESN
ncbi:MAG: peptidase U62 [Acidobacteria bacterium]|nr:MAG: peptidase U62 [Acidobacteriota bacterium]